MKFIAQMEDPEGLYDAIWEAAGGRIPVDLPDDEHFERTQSAKAREDQYREAISAWVDDDGKVRLEFDLDADPPTARVLRRDGKDGEADAATRALRLAEWGGWDTDVEDNCCPVCGAFEDSVTGHVEGCAIAEALQIPYWRQGPEGGEPEGGAE